MPRKKLTELEREVKRLSNSEALLHDIREQLLYNYVTLRDLIRAKPEGVGAAQIQMTAIKELTTQVAMILQEGQDEEDGGQREPSPIAETPSGEAGGRVAWQGGDEPLAEEGGGKLGSPPVEFPDRPE